ncbi:MAG: Glu/Leu/Phe/Val dehydrogenase dimerization domain-containing protein [Myxococcota bacterium]
MHHELLSMSVQRFVGFLLQEGIGRAHLVYDRDQQKVIASHPQLEPLARYLEADTRDFMEHEGVFLQVNSTGTTLQGAFVHRTQRGQAAGGVRYWTYPTLEDYLRDGLRLARGMTRKNALAGLWWGGGKGVIARNPALPVDDPNTRAHIYREYGQLLSALRGCYVTAEDVGTRVADMVHVHNSTRFTTCIPTAIGGSGNPSIPTARGVLCAMEAALDHLNPGDTLAGKTIAVQGMGHVGEPLLRGLLDNGVAHLIAWDINPELVHRVTQSLNDDRLDSRVVQPGDDSMLTTPCDVLSPCAVGAVLNPRTIPLLQATIVCGAANNQLEDPERDDRLLQERNILYVPDFLANRMGIVTCANEQHGYLHPDPLIERHLGRDWEHAIFRTTQRILHHARTEALPPAAVATALADTLSAETHPLMGHRGQAIIKGLVADRWFEQAPS